MVINLRGVKESGVTFAIPTYFFILMMYLTIIVGLVRFFAGTLGIVSNPPELTILAEPQALTLFLILKSFASGTASVTGVEAISDGIMAFRQPRSKNAGMTLIMMALILGSMLVGVTFLAGKVAAIPSEHETLVSQIARTVFDGQGNIVSRHNCGDDHHFSDGSQYCFCRLPQTWEQSPPKMVFYPVN